MPKEEVEVELLKGLRALQEWEARQAERRSAELEGVKSAVTNLTRQFALLEQKIDSQNAIWNERFAGLAARVDALEKDADDTSKVNVEALRERSKFWPELIRGVAIGVLAMVIGGGIMFAITKQAPAVEHPVAGH